MILPMRKALKSVPMEDAAGTAKQEIQSGERSRDRRAWADKQDIAVLSRLTDTKPYSAGSAA